ncbi:hypothetical protein CFOL_v3_03410 [Cephalotus follicularis]|uniref:Uncharacterized protein n=1 Tax=Cephalotus follicularis TaxID=3775 RepID=A0A1Q3AVX8_CEPFO|nr:hypothetical protein CFOL_v3_03410 [Cephalotus follicularis]
MEQSCKLRKEQEKERRRLQDRQRRQSMSIEEREKHLARRRRNYQLRRQRAENARFDPRFDHTSILDSDDMLTTNQNQLTSASDIIVQISDDAPHVVSGGRQGLEVPAHRLAEFPGKLRLNHLKRLARSLNDPVVDNHKIGADLFIKGNAASNCISPKGVRLNHVKQLARGLKSAVKENVPESLQSKSEG